MIGHPAGKKEATVGNGFSGKQRMVDAAEPHADDQNYRQPQVNCQVGTVVIGTERHAKAADAFNQYLAYHEGHGGWKRNTYREKGWLVGVARKVERYARTYDEQLRTCRKELEEDRNWWPL